VSGEPSRRQDPTLSIVIPAYEVGASIEKTLDRVAAFFDAEGLEGEVVAVDDGSRDGTLEAIERCAARDSRVVGLGFPHNRGKGAAVRSGLSAARGRVVAFTDADLPYSLEKIAEGAGLVEGGSDLVVGARDLAELDSRRDYPLSRRAASYLFGRFVATILGAGVVDSQCGLKVMTHDVARALADTLTVDGFAFDVEMLLLARRWGLSIERLPVTMARSDSSSVQLGSDAAEMTRDVLRLALRSRTGGLPPRPEVGERRDRSSS